MLEFEPFFYKQLDPISYIFTLIRFTLNFEEMFFSDRKFYEGMWWQKYSSNFTKHNTAKIK